MFKNIIASIRWGKLSKEEKEVLKTISLGETFRRPHLLPKLYKYYG